MKAHAFPKYNQPYPGDRKLVYSFMMYTKMVQVSAYKKAEINGKGIKYYAHRFLRQEDVLPWEHIDLGLDKEYFILEHNRAMEYKSTARCIDEKCKTCKICRHK